MATPMISLPTLGDRHALIIGGTRKGKSGLLELLARASLSQPPRPHYEGVTVVDPHGALVRSLRDWLANPANGQVSRKVHYIDPGTSSVTGINPLQTHDDSWEAAHDAATTLASAIESRFQASPEETPRLSRLLYVGGMICARHKLTIIELVELLSLGGEELRQSVLRDFDNRIVRRELEDLDQLARRSPRDFTSLVESLKNRLVRWLGDPRLQRLLGQRRGLDPYRVMVNAESVLVDPSGLPYGDACLIATLMLSMYCAAARRRPPLKGAAHRFYNDEAEGSLTIDAARGADQLAKNRLFFVHSVQRLGQLRQRDDFIADALFANSSVTCVFGLREPESARFLAEYLFAGHVNLSEWKPGSERPTAVGSDKVILKSRTRAHTHIEQSTTGMSDVRSRAKASAASDAFMASSSNIFATGGSSGFITMPNTAMVAPPMPLSQSLGTSAMHGRSAASGRVHGRTVSEQALEGQVRSAGKGVADGDTAADGESEGFVTRYELLPTTMFTLEEQLHKLAAEIMSLPRRECILRIESDAPIRTRTKDLTPAFRSDEFRALCVPRYLQKILTESRYAQPVAAIDADIASRIDTLTAPAEEPDFSTPEPMPTRPRPSGGRPHLSVVSPSPRPTEESD